MSSLGSLFLAALLATQDAGAVVKWRQDIAVARDEFLGRDKSYSPSARAHARQRLDRLSQQLPGKSDQEIVAALARIAASADNAHTRAYLLRNRGWWRRYPVRIWRFSDGWHVVAVRPGHEELLGARITSIGGLRIDDAEAAVRPLFAGAPGWKTYMAGYSLTSPDALLGTHVIRGDGAATFGLRQGRRRWQVRLLPADEPRRTVPEENWWFLSPAHHAVAGWTQALAGQPLPAYLASPDRWYALRHCAGDISYLPFTRSEDQPDQPTLEVFGRKVLAEVARNSRTRLVLDLRFNTGGNLQKTQAFFEELGRSQIGQARGRLFVILGPSTFSAGITPAAILRQGSKAIFVGSEPGDHLRFWAEGGNVLLPNSGITLHYADRAHLYTPGGAAVPEELVYLRMNARDLTPELPASTSFDDYVRARDPAAERIVTGGLRCPPA